MRFAVVPKFSYIYNSVLTDTHIPDGFICQARMNNKSHGTFPVEKAFINDVHLSFSPISVLQTINNLCFPNTNHSGRKSGLVEYPEIAGTSQRCCLKRAATQLLINSSHKV